MSTTSTGSLTFGSILLRLIQPSSVEGDCQMIPLDFVGNTTEVRFEDKSKASLIIGLSFSEASNPRALTLIGVPVLSKGLAAQAVTGIQVDLGTMSGERKGGDEGKWWLPVRIVRLPDETVTSLSPEVIRAFAVRDDNIVCDEHSF